MSYTNQVMLENAIALIEQQAARIAELEANVEGWHRAASNIAMWLGLSPAMGASEMQEAARARIAANGAEPIGYFINNARSGEKPHYAQIDPAFKSSPDVLPLYAAPVANGPRYDWTVTGMRQSETGNWVMAGEASGTDSAMEKDAERLNVLEVKLRVERAKVECCVQILSAIHDLLNPQDVKLDNGRIMRFSNPEFQIECYRQLSERIRKIPESLDAAIAASAETDRP